MMAARIFRGSDTSATHREWLIYSTLQEWSGRYPMRERQLETFLMDEPPIVASLCSRWRRDGLPALLPDCVELLGDGVQVVAGGEVLVGVHPTDTKQANDVTRSAHAAEANYVVLVDMYNEVTCVHFPDRENELACIVKQVEQNTYSNE